MRTSTPLWYRRPVRIVAVLALSVVSGCGLAAGYEQFQADPAPQLPTGEQQQLLDLINSFRKKKFCPPVKVDAALVATAQAQARDMVARGFLSSVNPDNEDPASRAHRFGYTGTVTESFAAGLSTPVEVVKQWTDSDNAFAAPVRKRILTCRMTSIGIGHDTGTSMPTLAAHVWVITQGDR